LPSDDTKLCLVIKYNLSAVYVLSDGPLEVAFKLTVIHQLALA
jgi:hypothetical protein